MRGSSSLIGLGFCAALVVSCSETPTAANETGEPADDASALQSSESIGEAAPPQDLATAARGATLVSASYDPARALALIDGDTGSNWSTPTRRNPGPYVFVVELMAPAALDSVGIDGSGERPGGVAGGSAGTVLIEGSAAGPDKGFRPLATIKAAAEGQTLAEVDAGEKVQWLRYTVKSARDPAASFIYLDELEAYGTLDPVELEGRFAGMFQTGRVDFIRLEQDGPLISGCYIENSGRSAGRITGSTVEGVALVNWRSDQGVTGTALFTRNAEGELGGLRYRQRSRSAWGGPEVADEGQVRCEDEREANPVAQALAEDGLARLYGIHFEFDSDVPKPSARPALDQLYEALAVDEALVVVIEGHTDADGSDGYNLNLSQRRANAVMQDMIARGISADRLSAEGKGESEPVASNDTADGRALNRRVEVRKVT